MTVTIGQDRYTSPASSTACNRGAAPWLAATRRAYCDPVAGRCKVLVVDDDADTRSFFVDALQLGDMETVAVASAEEALAVLDTGEPDVIVSDIAMPGVDGVQMLRQLRERSCQVPVILVTGDPSLQTALQAIECGVYRYLCKPVAPDELTEAVRDAFAQRKLSLLQRLAGSLTDRAGTLGESREVLEDTFARALQNLTVVFQPIFSASTAEVYGFEVLLRCGLPEIEGPAKLFSIAESLGRLRDLCRAVRVVIARKIEGLPADRTFFVNLHPDDLIDPLLLSPQNPLASLADRIVLEITEHARLEDLADLRERLASLRRIGFRIAVDDFGSGYSGLNSFAILEPDVVKIDLELVRDVDRNPIRRRLIRALVDLCRDMGILVVAEGVETPQELTVLIELGCSLLQGFLLARPSPELRSVPVWTAPGRSDFLMTNA